uniref:Uncharacterized protein n=1 Tax=Aegilops tauschii subsp. strangulata TaxID=200361 RepID=A0A453LC98_AEGTS
GKCQHFTQMLENFTVLCDTTVFESKILNALDLLPCRKNVTLSTIKSWNFLL